MVHTKHSIEQMKEAELRRDVIIPLMRAMGYQGVFEWHGGAGELGKDIVGWKEDDLESRRNKVVVAKADRISGAPAAGVVATQVHQSFNTGYEDPTTGERETIHECWVVTNKALKKEARAQVRSALHHDINPQVKIIDGEQLWDLVRKHLGVELQQVLSEAQQQIEMIDSPYRIGVHLPSEGTPIVAFESPDGRVVLTERYPGQLEEEPFTVSGKFMFPNTPEGPAKHREFERSVQTGESVEIPGEYLQIEFPEIINNISQQLFGSTPDKLGMLRISSAGSPKRVPVRIEVKCDDGDEASLDYIDLRAVQAGTHQIMLTNDDQPLPIRVVYTIDTQAQRINLTVSKRDGAIAAPVFLRLLQFVRAMHKPCDLRITLVETELPAGAIRRDEPGDALIDPDSLAVFEVLTQVQHKLRVPILVPDTEFTDDDWTVIRQLDSLLRSNERRAIWSEVKFPIRSSEVLGYLEAWRNESEVTFVEEQSVTLFGSVISIGPVQHTLESLRVANEAKVLEALSNAGPDDDVEFIVVPGTSNRMASQYQAW